MENEAPQQSDAVVDRERGRAANDTAQGRGLFLRLWDGIKSAFASLFGRGQRAHAEPENEQKAAAGPDPKHAALIQEDWDDLTDDANNLNQSVKNDLENLDLKKPLPPENDNAEAWTHYASELESHGKAIDDIKENYAEKISELQEERDGTLKLAEGNGGQTLEGVDAMDSRLGVDGVGPMTAALTEATEQNAANMEEANTKLELLANEPEAVFLSPDLMASYEGIDKRQAVLDDVNQYITEATRDLPPKGPDEAPERLGNVIDLEVIEQKLAPLTQERQTLDAESSFERLADQKMANAIMSSLYVQQNDDPSSAYVGTVSSIETGEYTERESLEAYKATFRKDVGEVDRLAIESARESEASKYQEGMAIMKEGQAQVRLEKEATSEAPVTSTPSNGPGM